MAELMYAIRRANGPFMAVYDIATDSQGNIPAGAVIGNANDITLPIQIGGVPLCIFLTALIGEDMYVHRWKVESISATQVVISKSDLANSDGFHARFEASLPHSHNADALGIVMP